jgi:hypothetical protein
MKGPLLPPVRYTLTNPRPAGKIESVIMLALVLAAFVTTVYLLLRGWWLS